MTPTENAGALTAAQIDELERLQTVFDEENKRFGEPGFTTAPWMAYHGGVMDHARLLLAAARRAVEAQDRSKNLRDIDDKEMALGYAYAEISQLRASLEDSARRTEAAERQAKQLREALQVLHDNMADYITRNKLGDPWHNEDMKNARAALSAAKEGS